jgi:rfaE bifunctional protein kinase chain/domain
MSSVIDISKFENKRIIVVGDIMLDEFVYTSHTRNSPEHTATPVLFIQDKRQYLGGAANVALNIKKLKAIPYLIGTVGDDDAAKVIHKLLHKESITNLYVHTNHRQDTTKKLRIFQDEQPVFRLDAEDVNEYSDLINHFILKNIQAVITNHKPHAIILQDYNKGLLNAAIIPEILTIAKQHNLLICVDPKFDNWELYQHVDLFKPNLNELRVMSDELGVKEDSIENISGALKQKINFKNLLVTLGAEGNFIYNANHSTFSTQHSTLENPDVCGAGDTVIAIASLALVCGFTLEQVAELANKAGYIVCQKENVQPVTIGELANSLIE